MKKWVENKEPSGAVVHTLVFGHHGDDPKVIVALFRDSEGDWFTTSNVLDTYWDLLTGKEVCEHDAKMMVEEMVYDHFADEKRYYEEICEELDMENKNLIEEYDEKSERFRKRWEERKAAEEKDGNRYREAYGKLYDKFLKTY
ncbi:hypothetical protein [Clostridium sp. CAG:43]|uniref:hypothetical protein n=1 Tax=Clostridium sp. CAG:43 TaxID=1262805 RepID=UPI000334C94D|nr:hypothetical protein [Clostridium sp. CAG:43]CDD57354.1 putative uncharacterized protein [Clostridium sp. CAG:43]